MLDYIFTFFAVFLLDLVYTYYLRSVQEKKAFMASIWSMACYLGASVAIINYTANHLLLIPAVIGAFFGTYVGMKIK
jgi:4-amino-4-deoxy-L-arabinose transferase-like glycosyltransferase